MYTRCNQENTQRKYNIDSKYASSPSKLSLRETTTAEVFFSTFENIPDTHYGEHLLLLLYFVGFVGWHFVVVGLKTTSFER